MARKKTVKSVVITATKSQQFWIKHYRGAIKKIRGIGSMLPIDLPIDDLVIDEFSLTYSPDSIEKANEIRAGVGRSLNITKWEKTVNEYSGKVVYRAKYKLSTGQELEINIKNGELAPGCQIVQVEQVRKVWKSVCPENNQPELTS